MPFHLARIALDDSMKDDAGTANYKCIKVCLENSIVFKHIKNESGLDELLNEVNIW